MLRDGQLRTGIEHAYASLAHRGRRLKNTCSANRRSGKGSGRPPVAESKSSTSNKRSDMVTPNTCSIRCGHAQVMWLPNRRIRVSYPTCAVEPLIVTPDEDDADMSALTKQFDLTQSTAGAEPVGGRKDRSLRAARCEAEPVVHNPRHPVYRKRTPPKGGQANSERDAVARPSLPASRPSLVVIEGGNLGQPSQPSQPGQPVSLRPAGGSGGVGSSRPGPRRQLRAVGHSIAPVVSTPVGLMRPSMSAASLATSGAAAQLPHVLRRDHGAVRGAPGLLADLAAVVGVQRHEISLWARRAAAASLLLIGLYLLGGILVSSAALEVPPASAADVTYVVQPGDTLSSIAQQLQLRGNLAETTQVLEAANPGPSLVEGQQLRIPGSLLP